MNDFTKEELEYLFRKFMLTNGDDFEHNLEAKLQSLIDNYCKHEFDMDNWVNDAANCRWYECKKCQRRYR